MKRRLSITRSLTTVIRVSLNRHIRSASGQRAFAIGHILHPVIRIIAPLEMRIHNYAIVLRQSINNKLENKTW